MNPFRDSIVASPWNVASIDVSEIHHTVFTTCLNGIDQIRTSQRSAGILIHGEAGSGKTHLLGRLRKHLAPQAPIATDRPESLFVWVRLQTSPRMLWRTLRRSIVEDWFRPVSNGPLQIDRILYHRLAAIRPAEWDLEPWYEYMLEEDPKGLKELVDQIASELHLDRNLAVAFEHIVFGRFRRELRAWLGGCSLPESVLERMELTADEGNDEELEDQARQFVLMLCQLTGPQLPILLSFDQVEALQIRPGDAEGLFAFGQMVSTLHDGTSNVLLVSCVQSAFAEELQRHVRGADYDRLTSLASQTLAPLNAPQARQLIAARLSTAGEQPPADAESPDCWPLSKAEFETMVSAGAVSPRKLLSICAERFESPEGTTPLHHPPGAVDQSAETDRSARLNAMLVKALEAGIAEKEAINTPDRTEEIIHHGLPLIVNLLSPQARVVQDGEIPDVSLIFDTQAGRLGLAFCTQAHMNSLQARLKRLLAQHAKRRLDRLVLIRDPRIPVSPGAQKAREYLQELESQQAATVFPQRSALVVLDALRSLFSDAKAGDLSFEGELVTSQELAGWLLEHLPTALNQLVDDIVGDLATPAAANLS